MNENSKTYPLKPKTVYFFGTCLIDTLYPEAGLDAIHLIEREGVKVIFPQDQTCCGQPAWNSGYRNEARKVARQQLTCFPEPYPIVVPSGSCAGMMRHHYPALFQGTPEEAQTRQFSARVYELTEFLVHVLEIELRDQGEPTEVVLHTACSARREMGVAAEHRQLIQQLGNVTLKTQAYEKECCGFGGTFAVKHPEISAAMVKDKAQHILATDAQQLISGDCGCLMNITGHLRYTDASLPSQHIASFLWERTHATDE